MGLGMVIEGGFDAVKNHTNSFLILYNQFLFCNSFLLFVQYLHGGHEDVFFDKKTLRMCFCLQNPR